MEFPPRTFGLIGLVVGLLLLTAAMAATPERGIREARCPEFQFLATAPFTDSNGKQRRQA